jgi:hypothetical protein
MVAASGGDRRTVTLGYDDFRSRLAAPGVDGSIVVSSGHERRGLDAARRSAEEHDCALQPLRSVRASKGDLMVAPAADTRSRHPASSSPRLGALADVAFVASAAT